MDTLIEGHPHELIFWQMRAVLLLGCYIIVSPRCLQPLWPILDKYNIAQNSVILIRDTQYAATILVSISVIDKMPHVFLYMQVVYVWMYRIVILLLCGSCN